MRRLKLPKGSKAGWNRFWTGRQPASTGPVPTPRVARAPEECAALTEEDRTREASQVDAHRADGRVHARSARPRGHERQGIGVPDPYRRALGQRADGELVRD